MPRSTAFAVENNFVKGLLTEFTGLNFPESACTDTLNCVFDNNGSIVRRLGFDNEANGTSISLPQVDSLTMAYYTYYWKNVSNSGERTFVVVQVGKLIRFFYPGSNGNISNNLHPTSIDLTAYDVSGAPDVATQMCNITEGNGYLFIAHPYMDPLAVKYDTATDTFTITQISIQIRDVKGLDESSIAVDNRPTVLTTTHKYNLYNQGWSALLSVAQGSISAFQYWDNNRTDYPSNSDVWWVNKDPNEFLNANWIDRVTRGNTPAPRGHYILSAFNQDRGAASGLSGLTNETSGYYRPSCVSFFAGRVWYAGINAINFSNNVYFSQIVKDPSDYSKCYQKEDPTNESLSDLLTTDGGVVKIIEAARIVFLLPIQQNLFVFATNGVWVISGSQGIGFTATDYSVAKVSEIGAISASSFVSALGTPFWWNVDGIYTLASSNIGNSNVVSVTETSNKTYFNEIPLASKLTAQGAFSLTNKEIIWLYQDADTSVYKFLTYRVANNAMSPYTVTSTRKIASVFAVEGFANNVQAATVTDNNGATVTASGGTVTVNVSIPTTLISTFRTLNINVAANTYTIGQFADSNLVDWASINSTYYSSYAISGYKIRGQGIKKFNMPYIQVYFDLRLYPQGNCYLQGIWDYSNNTASGRYTNPQQLYTTFTNQDFSFSRRKIRGNGISLQLKFYSYQNQPFQLIGWSEVDTGNVTP